MKLVAKWTIDKITKIPEIKALGQSQRVEGNYSNHQFLEMSLITLPSKKQKAIVANTNLKRIKSSLYNAHIESQSVWNDIKVDEMFDYLSKEKPTIHVLQVLNESEKAFFETKFGVIPVGSVLRYQCSLIPADFIYIFQILHLLRLKITSNHTLIKLRTQVKWAY